MTNLQRTQPPNPYDLLPALPTFTVTSTDFTDGQPLDRAHAADGGNTSPQLSWSGAPEGTRSYVVSCFDPDAPTPSGFWHWMLVDLPAEVTELDTGAGAEGKPTAGRSFSLRNDGATVGFMGAAPPPGDVFAHRYYFVVHSLDQDSLGLEEGSTLGAAAFQLTMAATGRAIIHGTYQH